MGKDDIDMMTMEEKYAELLAATGIDFSVMSLDEVNMFRASMRIKGDNDGVGRIF